MKKLFIILTAFSFMLVGCIDEESVQLAEGTPWGQITEFEYKGHKYIKFFDYGYEVSYGGVVHDPECECFKKQKNSYGKDQFE